MSCTSASTASAPTSFGPRSSGLRSGWRVATRTLKPGSSRCRTARRPRNPVPPSTVTSLSSLSGTSRRGGHWSRPRCWSRPDDNLRALHRLVLIAARGPNAPRPHRYGRPMQTACAPMASALTISVPRRKPRSTSSGIRAPTTSTISGNVSIVALATVVDAAAVVRDNDAVNADVSGQHRTILVRTVSRSRLTKSQVKFVALKLTPMRSILSKLGLWAT
jgi:hypothetical protein